MFEETQAFTDFYESISDERDLPLYFVTTKEKMRRRMANPVYLKRLSQAMTFIDRVREGSIKESAIIEAFSTSDFSALTTNILTWKTIEAYRNYPKINRQFTRIGRVQDFRNVKSSTLDGLDTVYKPVGEGGEYPEESVSERDYGYRVFKYGKGFGLTFESTINDFLGLFDELPMKLAQGAVNTEDFNLTSNYMAANGPVASFTDVFGNSRNVFSAGNKNKGTGVLNFANLTIAIEALLSQLSESGQPIVNLPKYLVVPPNLYLPAKQILNPGELFAQTVGRTDAAATPAAGTINVSYNYLADQNITVIMNPFLPIIGTTANGSSIYGQTSWFLFSDPTYGHMLELGLLAGHEEPELWQKKPNAIIVGGGEVPPGEGDFESDMIRWRSRMFMGSTILNPKFGYASDGSTS